MNWSIGCVASYEGNVHRVFRRADGNYRSAGVYHRDDDNLASWEKPQDAKGYDAKYYQGKYASPTMQS